MKTIIIFFLICISCTYESQNKNHLDIPQSLKIKFIGFDLLTYRKLNCDNFDISNDKNLITVSNSSLIYNLIKEINTLEPINEQYNPEPDTRAKILLSYSSGKEEIVCVGKYVIKYNQKSYQVSDNLRNLIEKMSE